MLQAWGRRGKDGRPNNWGTTAGYYILDQVRARMTYPETRAAAIQFAVKWRQATTILVEEKANGAALMADLQSILPGLVPYNPKESKEARAGLAAVAWEAGDVWIPSPEYAPWIGDFIEEYCVFPNGAHDDQVDAGVQMVLRYMRGGQADTVDQMVQAFGFLLQ